MFRLLETEIRVIGQLDPELDYANELLYTLGQNVDAFSIHGLYNVTPEKLEKLTKRMRYIVDEIREKDEHDVRLIVVPTNYRHFPPRTLRIISGLADLICIPYGVNTRNRKNLITGGRERGAQRFYDAQIERFYRRMMRAGVSIPREKIKKVALFINDMNSNIAQYTNAVPYQSLEDLLVDVEFETSWNGAEILHFDWGRTFGDPTRVKAVATTRDKIKQNVPIVVSGNISTLERGIEMVNSGADAIVLGDELKDLGRSLSIINAVKPKNSHTLEEKIEQHNLL